MSFISKMIFFFALLAVIYCNIGVVPPLVPPYYYAEFEIYAIPKDAKDNTPYDYTKYPDQSKIKKGTGKTYYNTLTNSYIDIYPDKFCAPILLDTYEFPCKFLNINNNYYAITAGLPDFKYKCCLVADKIPNFKQDFLRKKDSDGNYVGIYKGEYQLRNVATEYYNAELQEDTQYGFYSEYTLGQPGSSYPVFAYTNNKNTNVKLDISYTQKIYTKFEMTVPNQSIFDLPEECKISPLPGCYDASLFLE
jgi:hypothetical protein